MATNSDGKGVDTRNGCTESVYLERRGVGERGERGDLVLSVASRTHPKANIEIKVSPSRTPVLEGVHLHLLLTGQNQRAEAMGHLRL